MAKFVRKLEKAVWWDKEEGQALESLGADALKNVATDDNELSIYEVEEDAHLPLILAALSSRRQHIKDAEYCLFDGAVLAEAGVKTKRTKGNTSCKLVNGLHYDLVDLTALSLTKFVLHAAHGGELDSIDKKQVLELIKSYVQSGEIDVKELHAEVKKVLGF